MRLIKIFAFVLSVMSAQAFALDRAQIAEQAADVTPLLNGQKIPNVTLRTAEGDPVSLRAMVLQKPTIVLFYRGGWCPYCNRQLAGLKDIEQDLVKLGYQVLAISPESPERLQEQKLETEFAVTLLSDEKLDAIKQFGIGFYMPDSMATAYEKKLGFALATDSANARRVLPAPAIFMVDKKGVIQFNYVNPDFTVRLSPELTYQAAKLVL